MLSWASRFNICCFLDNHSYDLPGHYVECLLAAGALDSLSATAGSALDELQQFTDKYGGNNSDWLFGHLGYALTRETEAQQYDSEREDPIGFPDLFFFVPEILVELGADQIKIGVHSQDSSAHRDILEQILAVKPVTAHPNGVDPVVDAGGTPLVFHPRFTREEYLQAIDRLKSHILRGDCYEINFCQEFFAVPAKIDPLQTWWRLSKASPNPFSAFYRVEESYLLCASPERYLQRRGQVLISQPIKGTSPRMTAEPALDEAARENLFHSAKDRAENVMVVDLVRNDFSRICREGTVSVKELYGIYSFPQVHQMVSTIQGMLPENTGLTDCIRATFPMGSMTGAPKHTVVNLIDRYERSPRGLFSGAVGYVTPSGDFDFNVVIRSLLYNQRTGYLAYQVGSGITWYSDPLAEYEECMLKAEGMRRALKP